MRIIMCGRLLSSQHHEVLLAGSFQLYKLTVSPSSKSCCSLRLKGACSNTHPLLSFCEDGKETEAA